jgi:hypothetical protein
VVVLLVVLVALGLVPAMAPAEGSQTIASAPTVVFGQQEFGTTVGGAHLEKPSGLASFWSLPIIAGDQLTIDWEATLGSSTGIHLYPVGGVNDYTDQEAHTVAGQGQSDNGKNQLEYTAPTTGDMILAMVTNHASGASYNFIAYVRHAVALAMPRLGSVPHRKTVVVAVHAPDGSEVSDPSLQVTLEAKVHGTWKTVGRASVKQSMAKIKVKFPPSSWRRSIFVRATAVGRSYIRAWTRAIQVKVT